MLDVRSFSFTVSLSLFTEQYLALALIATNFSTSEISAGIRLPSTYRVHGYCTSFYLLRSPSKLLNLFRQGCHQVFSMPCCAAMLSRALGLNRFFAPTICTVTYP